MCLVTTHNCESQLRHTCVCLCKTQTILGVCVCYVKFLCGPLIQEENEKLRKALEAGGVVPTDGRSSSMSEDGRSTDGSLCYVGS